MYSLRSQSVTGNYGNNSITAIDFYILKKTSKDEVSYVNLQKPFIVFNDNTDYHLVLLNILEELLKNYVKNHFSLSREVYLCPEDYFKLCEQYLISFFFYEREKEIENFTKFMRKITSQNEMDMGKDEFVFYIKKYSSRVCDKKCITEFKSRLLELKSFIKKNGIKIKLSQRVNENLKTSLILKVQEEFKKNYLNNTEYKDKEIEKISCCLFMNKKEKEKYSFLSPKKEEKSIEEFISPKLRRMALEEKDKEEEVLVYEIHTDASILDYKAGIGAVVCKIDKETNEKDILFKMSGMSKVVNKKEYTTQTAELLAISHIVKRMESIKRRSGKEVLLRIFADNLGCVLALQGEDNTLSKNNYVFKILKEIKESPIRLTYHFEKGHVGNKWNELAHDLSRYGRRFMQEKFVHVK